MVSKVQIGVRLTPEEKQQIQVIADHYGRSVNAEIMLLVRQHIKQIREANKEIQLDIFKK